MTRSSSRQEVEGCLRTLAGAYPDAFQTQAALHGMMARYAPELEGFDARAVNRGCREAARECLAFPPLARLLPFVREAAERLSDALAQRALPPPGPDAWGADHRALGVGLQLLRGKLLVGGVRAVDAARAEFNRIVDALGGVPEARAAADEAYAKRGHEGLLAALLERAGPAPVAGPSRAVPVPVPGSAAVTIERAGLECGGEQHREELAA